MKKTKFFPNCLKGWEIFYEKKIFGLKGEQTKNWSKTRKIKVVFMTHPTIMENSFYCKWNIRLFKAILKNFFFLMENRPSCQQSDKKYWKISYCQNPTQHQNNLTQVEVRHNYQSNRPYPPYTTQPNLPYTN